MSKTRKILTMAACAVLLVCVTVAGTVAYLQSTTEVVKNTFTVGNVKITLDETDYDDSTPDADRDIQNAYHLLPGQTYTKDPIVTVKGGNDKCYVRAFVTIEYNEAADTIVNLTWINDLDQKNWTWSEPTTTKENGKITRVYEVRYNTVVEANEEDTTLPALFASITVPNTINNEDLAKLDGFKIDVVANAIQADGFDGADAAWAAFTK